MLYRPEAFEGLTETPWDDGCVRATIRAIVKDVDDAWRGPSLMWRADSWDRWHATSPMKSLYTGAAGVVWALDELRRRGHAETRLDLAAVAERALELFRARPDLLKGMPLPSPPEAALLMGETGILLVAWRVAPRGEFADDLYAHVRANVNNEADELMWGAPGTMIGGCVDARVDRRGALTRRVERERRRATRAAPGRRSLDETTLRQHERRPIAAARARRQRAGSAAAPRRQAA